MSRVEIPADRALQIVANVARSLAKITNSELTVRDKELLANVARWSQYTEDGNISLSVKQYQWLIGLYYRFHVKELLIAADISPDLGKRV